MVKKTKLTGKTRLDKYYYLAKEQGFRSRAAFKLIQLNRKYDFLSSARAIIDLCAAPGGWLQVCAKYMPVSSLLIGVDLDPIKGIPNAQTFQEDITTASCRSVLKKACQHWKVDVVLNDGSPNVGGAWTKDAFSQAELSLAAMKLATEFLRPGGLFICKVFRSQDSNSLLWAARQLFNRVEATKPSASRGTSAEIYFVCQGFKAPDKIDPRLLDPAHVFKAVTAAEATINVLRDAPMKAKRHRGGYEEGVTFLHKKISASDYFDRDTPAETLGLFNEISFEAEEDKVFLNNALTTEDIRVACADLKVLGRRDFKSLIQWRQAMRRFRTELNAESTMVDEDEVVAAPIVIDEETRLAQETQEMETLKLKLEAKRKRAKRKRKEQKVKARTRQLGMVNMEENDGEGGDGLFSLNQIGSSGALGKVMDSDVSSDGDSSMSDDGQVSDVDDDGYYSTSDLERELESEYAIYKERRGVVEKSKPAVGMEDDVDLPEVDMDNSDDSDGEFESNPLQVGLNNLDTAREESSRVKATRWFNRDLFEGIELGETAPAVSQVSITQPNKEPSVELEDGVMARPLVLRPLSKEGAKIMAATKNGFEEVPVEEDDWTDDSDNEAEMLAIGKMMLRKDKRREMEDASYNRYSFQDGALPSWFADDQQTHNKPILPVPAALVDEMKARLAAINARPIKKIAEARARKKVASVRRWEKVKSSAEVIAGSSEMPDKEKYKRLDALYKGKGKQTKREKQYVVNRKSTGAKPMDGPRKKNARLKMVDLRMKADKRGRVASAKAKKSTAKKRRK